MGSVTREDVLKIIVAARVKGERPDLTDVDLRRANLRGASLTGADLGSVNLFRADLRNADLTDTNLEGVTLFRADLTNADLTGADLTDADLNFATLTGADLTGANLTGANLEFVRSGDIMGEPAALPSDWLLMKGYLVGPSANLRDATLTDADLTKANLTDADLRGANLPPSALTNSTITGEQWVTAKVGPTKVTGDRLRELRDAAVTADLAELEKYAHARAVGVRVAAASNEACPEELLLKLISDKRDEVRQAVLTNPNCSDAVRVMAALQS